MPATDQGVNLDRYMFVPRTLIFITRGNEILLMKGAENKRLWPGLYNGIGGHIEMGEDILTAAKREVFEETGITDVEIQLCGIVSIDTQVNPGVCIFVFKGEADNVDISSTPEGTLEWISTSSLESIPLVADLPLLLLMVKNFKSGSQPFIAHTFYDDVGKMILNFL